MGMSPCWTWCLLTGAWGLDKNTQLCGPSWDKGSRCCRVRGNWFRRRKDNDCIRGIVMLLEAGSGNIEGLRFKHASMGWGNVRLECRGFTEYRDRSRGCEGPIEELELKSGGDRKPLKIFEQERYSRATLQRIEDWSLGIWLSGNNLRSQEPSWKGIGLVRVKEGS